MWSAANPSVEKIMIFGRILVCVFAESSKSKSISVECARTNIIEINGRETEPKFSSLMCRSQKSLNNEADTFKYAKTNSSSKSAK